MIIPSSASVRRLAWVGLRAFLGEVQRLALPNAVDEGLALSRLGDHHVVSSGGIEILSGCRLNA